MRDDRESGCAPREGSEELERELLERTRQLRLANEELLREVDRHRQSEEALKKSEANLLALFAAMTDIILVLDSNGRYLNIAPTSATNLYLKPEQLIGRRVHDVFPPADADRILEQIHRSLELREALEYQYMLAIGTREVWFDSRISPISTDTVFWIARDVTAYKLVEARLQEYEKAVEGLEEMIVVVDSQYRYVIANRAFLSYRGMQSEQLEGRGIADVLNPGVFENVVKKQLDRCFKGQIVKYELSYDYPKLGTRVLSISYYPIHGHAGIDRAVCVLQDITDIRQADESLRLLKSAIEQTDEIVFMTDVEGRITYLNSAFEEIYGYSKDEAIGKTPRILKSGTQEAAQFGRLWACILAGQTFRGEYINKAKDGALVHVDSAIDPVFDADRHLVGFIAVQEDISAHKISEERFRKSEERFRLIAENVTDLISVLDLDGKRTYSSPSYKQILLDPESLEGTDAFGEIHPEDRDRIRQAFAETVRTGVGQRADYRHLLKDGVIRYIECQMSAIRDVHAVVASIVVVSRDVTDRKMLEQQFLRAQRMESIGTLASGIAHDLNNVLTPILMSVDLVRRTSTDPAGQKWLDMIETLTNRGTNIVKQVLGFGRGVYGERILLQLQFVLNEIIKIAEETFPKSIDIQGHIPKSLWAVLGDPTQLHQIFLNVCVNARDAMPDGGTLRITAENIQLDDQSASMLLEARPGAYVVTAISDTGTGIPLNIRERIFEPFFTTKEPGKGTGLGLSTALAIVRNHAGFMDLHSEPGKGTTFKIYMPADVQGQSSLIEEIEKKTPLGHGELILVIDDEVSIREATRETLEAHGYTAILAGNGAEGIGLFAERKSEIKAVITDMMMPIMDGTATISALKTLEPEIMIIGTSGLARNSSEVGVQAFLEKPYSGDDLLWTLHDLLTA